MRSKFQPLILLLVGVIASRATPVPDAKPEAIPDAEPAPDPQPRPWVNFGIGPYVWGWGPWFRPYSYSRVVYYSGPEIVVAP